MHREHFHGLLLIKGSFLVLGLLLFHGFLYLLKSANLVKNILNRSLVDSFHCLEVLVCRLIDVGSDVFNKVIQSVSLVLSSSFDGIRDLLER